MKRVLILTGGILSTLGIAAQQKPNIVLIIADDMRNSTLGFLGKEESKTPVLDNFSSESTVFTNTHIMGATSGAVSMPSRAMLMTGKYLQTLDRQGGHIPESHTTIGEVLIQAGYKSFHTGKWHSDKASFNRSFNSGKDIFFGGMADHWNVPLFNYDPKGKYLNTRRIIEKPLQNNDVKILQGEYVYSGKHSVDIFTDTAIEFIESQKEEKEPFFLSLCYISPHDPRSMPDEFMQLYNPQEIALPSNYLREHPFDNGELDVRDELLAKKPRIETEIRKHIAEYYAMISHLDNRIGDVLEALKANGMYDNTIIIFLADNGLAVGQHGLMGKQSLYEHSVNVPLIIKTAGQSKDERVTDELCYLIDLFPTICEWVGVPIPKSVDGLSMLPVINENKAIRDHLYYSYRDFQRAVSDGEWKLIEYRVKEQKHTQLFNLKTDPMETINLSEDKKYTKRLNLLREKMIQLKDVTKDNSKFWELY